MTRRSTATITVLLALSLTTVPCRTRLGMSSTLFALAARLEREDGFDAGDVAPHHAHARRVLELAARPPEAQVELLLLQLGQVGLQLVRRLDAQVFRFHRPYSTPRRVTILVLIGSLAAASAKASRAVCSGTPSISNMMRPGWTRATQYSGVPLPLPMR